MDLQGGSQVDRPDRPVRCQHQESAVLGQGDVHIQVGQRTGGDAHQYAADRGEGLDDLVAPEGRRILLRHAQVHRTIIAHIQVVA